MQYWLSLGELTNFLRKFNDLSTSVVRHLVQMSRWNATVSAATMSADAPTDAAASSSPSEDWLSMKCPGQPSWCDDVRQALLCRDSSDRYRWELEKQSCQFPRRWSSARDAEVQCWTTMPQCPCTLRSADVVLLVLCPEVMWSCLETNLRLDERRSSRCCCCDWSACSQVALVMFVRCQLLAWKLKGLE